MNRVMRYAEINARGMWATMMHRGHLIQCKYVLVDTSRGSITRKHIWRVDGKRVSSDVVKRYF